MDFEYCQNEIANKLTALNKEKARIELVIESAEFDLTDSSSIRINDRYQKMLENIRFIEIIAMYIVQQEEQSAMTKQALQKEQERNAALRNINSTLKIQYQSTRAALELHKSKWRDLERAADEWITQQFDQTTEESAIIQNLIAA
jgi:hypothetical protein